MRKQLWAAAALMALALQPAQAQLVTQTFNIRILQAQPLPAASAEAKDFVPLPSGIQGTANCIVGTADGVTAGATPACRFVGSVLCIDPGPDGKFTSFTAGCPADTDPVVQGIKLIKTVPRVAKCPDLWPGVTFVQTGRTGIRTFFPLKFTPCDTVFSLQVEIGCVNRTLPRRPVQVRVNVFNFRVSVRPETLAWVVEALHCQPLGIAEVPCITDESLFRTLVDQANAIAANVGDATKLRALNDALDNFEATVVRNCMFQTRLFSINPATGALDPVGGLFRGNLPGNATIGPFGFGIVDTVEHPCCCKLIADLVCLKRELIGGF